MEEVRRINEASAERAKKNKSLECSSCERWYLFSEVT
jgi:formylmethanofuran dehydrogenase subunit E